MKNLISILAIAITTIALTGDAYALAPFKKAFEKKYLAEHENEDYQKLAKKTGCNLCHVKKAKKNFRNEYGEMLAKLIEGDAQARIKAAKKEGGPDAEKKEKAKVAEELEKAFDKVIKEKSAEGKGPTFEELIKAGKLPVEIDAAVAKHKADLKKKADKEGAEIKDADSK